MTTSATRIALSAGGASDVRRSSGRLRPADHFVRAATCVAKAAAFNSVGSGNTPESILLRTYRDDDATPYLLQRTASSPAQMSGTWGGQLAATSVVDFVSSLAVYGASGELFKRGLKIGLEGRASGSLPTIIPTASNAAWVAEGAPIAVGQPSFGAATIGPVRKLAGIFAYTNELAMMAVTDFEAVIRQVLSETIGLALDASIFSNAAASSSRPAGLLNGVTGITATAGGSVAAMRTDFTNLMAALVAAGGGRNPLFFASPQTTLTAKILFGADLPFELIPTSAIAAGTVIAIEPSAFASAFDPIPRFDVANDALLHFDDASALAIGTVGSPATVAAPTRSLYQHDSSAVKVSLQAAWALRGTGFVQFVSSVSW